MVRQGQERRPGPARRQQQLGRLVHRGAIGRGLAHAERPPSLRKLLGPLGQAVVEVGGQDHLAGAGLAPPPGRLVREEVGGGGQGVVGRAPDVAPTVAVGVDREGEIVLGGELGLAHGPGPGALELLAAGLGGEQDAQRRQQLALGPVLAPPLGRQGGERADHVHVALDAAVAGLDAPDADQELGLHAVLGRDPGQPGARLHPRAALGDAAVRHHALYVVADGLGEFGLARVGGDHARIRRQALERVLHLLARPAGAHRAVDEALHPGAEQGVAARLPRARSPDRDGRRGDAGNGHEEGAAIHAWQPSEAAWNTTVKRPIASSPRHWTDAEPRAKVVCLQRKAPTCLACARSN